MKTKLAKTDAQIDAQEAKIPSIANKAFRTAFLVALSKGEPVLVVRDGHLVSVSSTETVVIRPVEPCGTIKAGTRFKIKKKSAISI